MVVVVEVETSRLPPSFFILRLVDTKSLDTMVLSALLFITILVDRISSQ